MRKSIKFCLASLFVLAFFALSAMAQGTVTGSINGTVMNPEANPRCWLPSLPPVPATPDHVEVR